MPFSNLIQVSLWKIFIDYIVQVKTNGNKIPYFSMKEIKKYKDKIKKEISISYYFG